MPSLPSKPAISPVGRRELIVVATQDAALRASPSGLASAANVDVSSLANVLGQHGATLQPLFGVHEDHLKAEAAAVASTAMGEVPDLSVYYHVQTSDASLDARAGSISTRAHCR